MYKYGYPKECEKCKNSADCKEKKISIKVEPYEQEGNDLRLMLIGQDPTIFNNRKEAKVVLMLKDKKGQLRRWMCDLIGSDIFENSTIYATNIIKCTFPKPPSTYPGKNFLFPYYSNCSEYLLNEVINFRPTVAITFGEPAHRYFTSLFDNKEQIRSDMQSAFGKNDSFFRARISGFEFSYSPSLHIKTFRVAEVYGDKVKNFRNSLKSEIKNKL